MQLVPFGAAQSTMGHLCIDVWWSFLHYLHIAGDLHSAPPCPTFRHLSHITVAPFSLHTLQNLFLPPTTSLGLCLPNAIFSPSVSSHRIIKPAFQLFLSFITCSFPTHDGLAHIKMPGLLLSMSADKASNAFSPCQSPGFQSSPNPSLISGTSLMYTLTFLESCIQFNSCSPIFFMQSVIAFFAVTISAALVFDKHK